MVNLALSGVNALSYSREGRMFYATTVEVDGFDFDNEVHLDYIDALPFEAVPMSIGGMVKLDVEIECTTPAMAAIFVNDKLKDAPFNFSGFSLDLVTVSEIANRAGVTRQAAQKWTAKTDFPVPLTMVGSHKAWAWADVSEWLVRTDKADELVASVTQIPIRVLIRMNGALAAKTATEADGWPSALESRESDELALVKVQFQQPEWASAARNWSGDARPTATSGVFELSCA